MEQELGAGAGSCSCCAAAALIVPARTELGCILSSFHVFPWQALGTCTGEESLLWRPGGGLVVMW